MLWWHSTHEFSPLYLTKSLIKKLISHLFLYKKKLNKKFSYCNNITFFLLTKQWLVALYTNLPPTMTLWMIVHHRYLIVDKFFFFLIKKRIFHVSCRCYKVLSMKKILGLWKLKRVCDLLCSKINYICTSQMDYFARFVQCIKTYIFVQSHLFILFFWRNLFILLLSYITSMKKQKKTFIFPS